jgi:2-iminobutanoate/2-iminopropanoate deaminase
MDNIRSILDHEGLAWTDVIKVTKYLTDMRDMDGMVAAMAEYFGDWTPASTTVCVNQLSTPGARVELDMIASYPRK